MTPLCSAPFTSYSHKPEGFRPCCSRHAKPVQSDVATWWNGEYLREFRKNMFRYDTLPPECKACIDEDGAGGEKYSHRFDMSRYNAETGEVSCSPSQVYLFTGSKCNLACEMCDSTFSDQHAKRFPERVIPVTGDLIDPLTIAGRFEPAQWVVYGGEPMLFDRLYDLVLTLLQKGGMISFLTNGMYNIATEPVFQDLIFKFPKRFSVTFSLDGDEKLNESIRHGASTKRILQNTKACLEAGVFTDIHFTHSTLNTHGFVDFCRMLLDSGLYEYPFTFNTCAVEFPRHFSPHMLQQEEKAKVIDDILSFTEEMALPEDMMIACQNVISALQHKVGDIL